MRICTFKDVKHDQPYYLDYDCAKLKISCISIMFLLKYVYVNNEFWAIIHLISSNKPCSMEVHINLILLEVKLVNGCKVCNILYCMLRWYFTKLIHICIPFYTSVVSLLICLLIFIYWSDPTTC